MPSAGVRDERSTTGYVEARERWTYRYEGHRWTERSMVMLKSFRKLVLEQQAKELLGWM